jgi:hypothetical protein
VSALVVTPAVGADPAVDVEAGDHGHHRGQVGLVLRVDHPVGQRHPAVRAAVAGDVEDLIDLGGDGPSGVGVPLGAAGPLGVGLGLVAAEGRGLALALFELLAQFGHLPAQLSDVPLQPRDGGIPRLAAAANRSWGRVAHAVEVGAPRRRGRTSFAYFTVTMYSFGWYRAGQCSASRGGAVVPRLERRPSDLAPDIWAGSKS